jgi:hypothetical protein
MSETTTCKPSSTPGGMLMIPVLRWIEQPDPGGVSMRVDTP